MQGNTNEAPYSCRNIFNNKFCSYFKKTSKNCLSHNFKYASFE